MSTYPRKSPVVLAGALALALVGTRCGGGKSEPAPAPAAGPAAMAEGAEPGHPETFEAAKALAAQRNVPLLVDFYSPT